MLVQSYSFTLGHREPRDSLYKAYEKKIYTPPQQLPPPKNVNCSLTLCTKLNHVNR